MRGVLALSLSALLLPLTVGCGQNAYTLHHQNQQLAEQQQGYALQQNQLQSRASSLDHDNQELEALLAQSRQQIQLLKDELGATREQLRGTAQQLASLQTEKQGLEQRTRALTASVQRRVGATITPNNSLIGDLSVIHLPGIEVRQDGDVIRIELPGEKLFHPATATLAPQGTQLVDSVMADVIRNYPNQKIGVEGHTDSDPISTPQFPSNQHLSTARALVVYDQIVRRFPVDQQQIFVVGHGANHPVVSNATAAGKARNRRVELVVYPESVSGR